MNQRFLLATALIAATLAAGGLLLLDIPLANWIHGSRFENAAFFVDGLAVLDHLFGIRIWYWIAAAVCIPLGLAAILLATRTRLPRELGLALLTAGLVQAGTIGAMMLGKNLFGRLRPQQLFESGDWTTLWFSGGGSFPSGHASFYFGLFLPLAASAPRAWQRAVLIAVPVYVALARIDMNRHFISDVCVSALIASLLALLMVPFMRRWQPAP